MSNLKQWIEENSDSRAVWILKRLSANDTLASGGHQAGPYIPKKLSFEVFPELNKPEVENPDLRFSLILSPLDERRIIRVVWYNNRMRGGTRDEVRFTNFGGAKSTLLAPDSTGAVVAFVFLTEDNHRVCKVWVSKSSEEVDLFEGIFGEIEPKQFILWKPESERNPSEFYARRRRKKSCWLTPDQIPILWLERFPSCAEIIEKTVELVPKNYLSPDERLYRRRKCEWEVYRSIEEAYWTPRILSGFENLSEFLGKANSILQSRKARSGRSLELHTLRILEEEGLESEISFSYSPILAENRRPDFVFPNSQVFFDLDYPVERLRLLAVKTTCRDRWRQILNESQRVKIKHLLTLQEGISENQYAEMKDSGVKLIVPEPFQATFPKAIRNELMSLEDFIKEVKEL